MSFCMFSKGEVFKDHFEPGKFLNAFSEMFHDSEEFQERMSAPNVTMNCLVARPNMVITPLGRRLKILNMKSLLVKDLSKRELLRSAKSDCIAPLSCFIFCFALEFAFFVFNLFLS